MSAFGALALVAWNLPDLGARRPLLSGRLRRFFSQPVGAFSIFGRIVGFRVELGICA
ncbi:MULTISPECIES: hypothetical protein [Bradyrhizobium]|uniref:hypothetical protein n=1 Tax=Bradyrhizobium TaxID=374 RepID=UPI0004BCBB8E|nr:MULTISPECIES: hypothetical protein [unclassified Bradyrhizobium]